MEKEVSNTSRTSAEILGILLVCLLFLVVFGLPWSIGMVKIFMFFIGGG